MKKYIWPVFVLMGLLACLALQDAVRKKPSSASSAVFAQVTDDAGRTVTIKESRSALSSFSTSLLNFADAVDGDLAGRASVRSDAAELPERYADVPEVGPTTM